MPCLLLQNARYILCWGITIFSDLPREITLDIGPYKVWVTHGHNYYVSMGNETIKKKPLIVVWILYCMDIHTAR